MRAEVIVESEEEYQEWLDGLEAPPAEYAEAGTDQGSDTGELEQSEETP